MKLGKWLIVLFVMSFLASGITGCDSARGKAQAKTSKKENKETVKVSVARPINISVKELKPKKIRDILILPGTVRVWKDVLVSASMGGKIEWIGPSEGNAVSKGELLARIDASVLQASLEKAEAGMNMTEDVYQRRLKLFERKIITQEALDVAQTERTLAKGTVRQLRTQLKESEVRAPIDGRINKNYVDAGEFVGPGVPMFDIVNINRMNIDVNVPEMEIRYLKVGQKTLLRIDAMPDRTISGVITYVAYKADRATKTFRVSVRIKNPKKDIREGMIARLVFLKQEITDAMVIPLSALVDKSGERLVFVVEDNLAKARTVSIGVIERERIQITKGLKPGDLLVVTGQAMLEEGMRVSYK